jgi:hypothetical protein
MINTELNEKLARACGLEPIISQYKAVLIIAKVQPIADETVRDVFDGVHNSEHLRQHVYPVLQERGLWDEFLLQYEGYPRSYSLTGVDKMYRKLLNDPKGQSEAALKVLES